MVNLIDILHIYAIKQESSDLFCMLNDYELDERLDRNTMNKVIIKDLGAMRPITTVSIVFKVRLDTFFTEYKQNISKLLDTLNYEYNPIHTKDMYETEHRESTGDIDNTDNYQTNNTNENKVSAYDSNNYENKDRTTNDTQHSAKTTSDIKSDVDTEKHMYGKDGETAIQDLIEKERKIDEFNIYRWITQKMKKELFLLIY